MKRFYYIILTALLTLLITGCSSFDADGDEILNNFTSDSYEYDCLIIRVIMPNNDDMIYNDLIWPVDVYAVYKGKRYNCWYFNNQNKLLGTMDCRFFMTSPKSGAGILTFGIDKHNEAYDDAIELHWFDGSVDRLDYSVWTEYDSYSGINTVNTQLTLNSQPVKGVITITKSNLPQHNIYTTGSQDADLYKEPILWTLGGSVLTDFSIDMPIAGGEIYLKATNYPALDADGIDIGGCDWITYEVNGNDLVLRVMPSDGLTRTATVDVSMYCAKDTFEITQPQTSTPN